MDQEKQWIKRIKKNGSSEAANELVSAYYQEMFGFVYKQMLDREVALDLTQEIFISVLKSIQHFDHRKASFRTWLYRLASNRVVDYYRSKHYQYGKHLEHIEGYEVEDERDMTLSLEYKEDYEKVASIINTFDVNIQQVIRLKLFGEYQLQEIADIVQIPLSTVKTRYYAAMKIIKKEMKEYHNG